MLINLETLKSLLVGKNVRIFYTNRGAGGRVEDGLCKAVVAVDSWFDIRLTNDSFFSIVPDTITEDAVEGRIYRDRSWRRRIELV
jgi:hypothetical protein